MMCFGACILIYILCVEAVTVWTEDLKGFEYIPQKAEDPVSTTRGDELTERGKRDLNFKKRSATGLSHESVGGGLAIDTLPDNFTHIVEDDRKYYSWRSFGAHDPITTQLWVDLTSLEHSQVRVHGILSNTHRQASRVALSFDFPFYGHHLRQITIATGGFIFTGEVIYRMLTATQYIAPLMANFDPSISKNSTVRYYDNGTVFVVQWDRVILQGRKHVGAFTFQVVLHKEGNITFSYRDVPIPIREISSVQHPVKVGLSDAFMVSQKSSQSEESHRRTIYEYHRVELDTEAITNMTAFRFTPLPTCLQHNSCETCLNSKLTSDCNWCHVIQRCSDGIDRHRQEWLDYNCEEEAKGKTCEDYVEQTAGPSFPSISVTPPDAEPSPTSDLILESLVTEDDTKTDIQYTDNETSSAQHGTPMHSGIIAGIVSAALLLLAISLLALYINRHPTFTSALFFLKRRSNQWPAMKFRNQASNSSYTEIEVGGHEKDSFIEAEQC
ncbi:plexin domain-containing protein 1 isoform X1 [Polypterus senegalus]|uniref:plexin domain-containing protein 1 isoform X1 n=1 Tax=Polypterus senegalus TaxID=55291 RepID=UPI001963FFFE|nr:plexin domain-containing protein 1 isoform X1 [Polypterus senegalus]